MPYTDAQRKQYYAIKNVMSGAEKALVNFYELQWALRHRVPTIEEVAKHIKQSQVSVNYYLKRRPVIQALEKRGIPWQQHSQSELTATQVATAVTMMNFTDIRPNDEKLDQLGVSSSQYYAWLNDPQFRNLIDNLADQNLNNIRPAAIGEFTKLINKGDWQAIKYYLDITGTVRNNDAPQSEILIKMIVEIVQKHVKDPEVMVAIAMDLKAVTHNRSLEIAASPPELLGEIVDEKELEYAKNQLGI